MFEADIFREIVEVIHYILTKIFNYNRNLFTFIYTKMADERQVSYDEDEEIARMIEEFDNIDEEEEIRQHEEEEIRQHNEIVCQQELYKEQIKRIKKELRVKERRYFMEIQKYIITMLDLNIRLNYSQSFDEKQVLFQEQLEILDCIKRLERDLLELMNSMSI